MSRQLQTDLLISTAVNNIASHHLSIKEIQYDPSFSLPFIAMSYCEDKKIIHLLYKGWSQPIVL